MKSKVNLSDAADLHMHSTASDGTLSPAELAEAVKKAGLRAAALTDHDTLFGLREFSFACQKLGVEPINGVELSVDYPGEMHIVGLFIDSQSERLEQDMENLRREREKRNLKMLEKLRECGAELDVCDLLCQKPGAKLENCGRPHFARALMAKGYVCDINEAFQKYLAKGAKCYVKRAMPSPERAIEIIRNSGGIAVWAHPISVSDKPEEIARLAGELKGLGLGAMECWHSKHSPEFKDEMIKICKSEGLCPSGGSDFHGENKPNVPLGIVCGDMCVPYSVVGEMKKVLED
ncbi:MAG: PHP domain-containing protein [Clostridiales bacterium]|nr:PHP domain-containing protein [Clostridiales bacterium]